MESSAERIGPAEYESITPRRLLTVSEAADGLGVSAASLRKWSDEGYVESLRTPGGQRRYEQEALDRFIESMREAAAPSQAIPPDAETG